MKKNLFVLIEALIICTLTACQIQDDTGPVGTIQAIVAATQTAAPTAMLTATPVPPRVLTICSQEPASLFYYGDASSAAKSVLQAIYDGPFDLVSYQLVPVILEKIPQIEDGDAILRPVDVVPGTIILDTLGNWVSLEEGMRYRPSGCTEATCTQTYEGTAPVQMDVLELQFRLHSGILWSDGTPLTAADSVYSYKVLKALYPDAPFDLVQYTRSYNALDEQTVEWVGIPGYVGTFATKFASPLPEHQLGGLTTDALLTAEVSSRTPMGWGPYIIDEWVAGDHLTLSRNSNYFRASEGLPKFDHLVYRFMADGNEAIDALVIGECDTIDRTLLSEAHLPRLSSEQDTGNLSYVVQTGTAWELAAYGIDTRSQRVDWFGQREVRQAIAMCIDRERIVDELLYGIPQVPDTYMPPTHPLAATVTRYAYDPETAGELLASAGWLDLDGDPNTPRVSAGVPNIPDGTPLSFTYLVPPDAERPQAAGYIQDGLASCGIGVDIRTQDWESLMAPGPEGPLFGRNFEMAQLAWTVSLEPTCNLFMSEEVPGPYPEYPRGWGGSNLSGYSNPAFDEACRRAMTSLPGSPAYLEAHQNAQAIFAQDLPALPLYQRIRLAAVRPDMCDAGNEPEASSGLSNIEALDYGEGCD